MEVVPLQGLRQNLDFYLDEVLSPDARREIFVGYVRERIDEAEDNFRAAAGRAAASETFVDGVMGARLENVDIPGGTIAWRVRPIANVADRALEIIDLFTKVVTGDFKSFNTAFIDDQRVSLGAVNPLPGQQLAITNLSPFSRKAEVRAFNDKDDSGFRNGLFEATAQILRREFRGVTPVRFTYRSFDGRRLPTILIG